MFFANNIHGEKIYIDDAVAEQSYACPACGDAMIQKHGNVNAHHFAHKAGKECDPWYTGKLSQWHKRMQNIFDKSQQEVIIWNEARTEFHVADIALHMENKKYIVEFQHSTISQKEFLSRSIFYMNCGYKVMWVFDFCESKHPKKILIADDEYENNIVRLVWPGKDRVRFFDNIDFCDYSNCLYVFFHINTGKGHERLCAPDGYCPWTTWEYINPFQREPRFFLLCLNRLYTLSDFFAYSYSEETFYKQLGNLCKH